MPRSRPFSVFSEQNKTKALNKKPKVEMTRTIRVSGCLLHYTGRGVRVDDIALNTSTTDETDEFKVERVLMSK